MDELKKYLEDNSLEFTIIDKVYTDGSVSQVAKINLLFPNDMKYSIIGLCRQLINESYAGYRCVEYTTKAFYDEKEEYVYIVKNPGFDDAFMAVKKIKPYLDEKKFAMFGPGEYDGDLVSIVSEVSEVSNDDIIDKIHTKIKYATDFYKLTINISIGNIDKNKIVLEKIIKLKNGSKDQL